MLPLYNTFHWCILLFFKGMKCLNSHMITWTMIMIIVDIDVNQDLVSGYI